MRVAGLPPVPDGLGSHVSLEFCCLLGTRETAMPPCPPLTHNLPLAHASLFSLEAMFTSLLLPEHMSRPKSFLLLVAQALKSKSYYAFCSFACFSFEGWSCFPLSSVSPLRNNSLYVLYNTIFSTPRRAPAMSQVLNEYSLNEGTPKQLPAGIRNGKRKMEGGRNIFQCLNILAHITNIYLQPNMLKVFYTHYHIYALHVHEAAINICILLKGIWLREIKILMQVFTLLS